MKGVSGLIFKPITGGLDALSKAAEGTKNSLIDDINLPREKRIRKIRAFYDIDRYYKKFKSRDAEIINFLTNLNKGI
jgi:hypothetical protein